MFGAALLPASGWMSLNQRVKIELACSALLLACAYVGVVVMMRIGRAAAVQPVRYSLLLWATLWGHVVFHENPDRFTIGGAAFVVAAGIGSLWDTNNRGLDSGNESNVCTQMEDQQPGAGSRTGYLTDV